MDGGKRTLSTSTLRGYEKSLPRVTDRRRQIRFRDVVAEEWVEQGKN